jgi:hypothetical protein
VLGFDEELERHKRRSASSSSSSFKLNPHIGDYVSLPQFNNPSPAAALQLLKRLAADPGIVKIMENHRWTVGALKEVNRFTFAISLHILTFSPHINIDASRG